MTQPICKVGDRTDFMTWDILRKQFVNMVGEVTKVIDGRGFEHRYEIKCGSARYSVHESRVATPFGDDDD